MAGLGDLHDRLHGGLWHTTHPDRIPAVVAHGALLIEPKIDESERWKTSRGPEYHPFVRTIGGVSLFDFHDFDADSYQESYPLSFWRTFVPYVEKWGGAVWLEIDRDAITDSFVSADEIIQRWDAGGHHKNTIMPGIEAAHIGDLPVSAVRSAFLTWEGGRQVRDFCIIQFNLASYRRLVNEWKTSACGGSNEIPI